MAKLNKEQIRALESQGCEAADWSIIKAAKGFDPRRVRNTRFIGSVVLGANDGEIEIDGARWPAGVSNAAIADCEIGDNVSILNVGSRLSNLRIEDGAVIHNVAEIVAEPKAACGNGVRVEAPNEGGGRTVTLFNGLNAQIAYMLAFYRHNEAFIRNLEKLIGAEVEKARSPKTVIASGARITNCGALRNVAVGPQARIDGALRLRNGTVNSCVEAPTEVGAGVWAESFLFSEGARVDSGAVLSHTFVGQGAHVGKQFSAENCLFFANCELLNGEGCAAFGGPYTLSHHKSTLLIAGLSSFFNAGSGTNASNHMYKLGPVHQGILERGCKSGSFSYLLLESHIGAFSTIIGKHLVCLDTPNMPFSYLIEERGASVLIPAINLAGVGLVRDAEKWPSRDRRKMKNKRDLIVFDVYSPYSVEKMRRGRADLNRLCESTQGDSAEVIYGGARMSRSRMLRGARLYEMAVRRYLTGKVTDRLEAALAAGSSTDAVGSSMKAHGAVREPSEWTDVGGLLAARERMAELESAVAQGAVASIAQVEERLRAIHQGYADDEWEYVCAAYEAEYGARPEALTAAQLRETVDAWEKHSTETTTAILADAEKEFGAAARIGYGLDRDASEVQRDFHAVRGSMETNKVTRGINDALAAIGKRAAALREKLNA